MKNFVPLSSVEKPSMKDNVKKYMKRLREEEQQENRTNRGSMDSQTFAAKSGSQVLLKDEAPQN